METAIMGAGSSAIVFGLFFLLLLGPALWLPSFLRWRIRTQSHRVRGLAAVIGEPGARLCYIGMGVFVSLIGIGYIISGATTVIASINPGQPQKGAAGKGKPQPAVAVIPPTRVLSGVNGVAHGLVFSPDGARLMNSGKKFQLWNLDTGTLEPGLDTSDVLHLRLVQAMTPSSNYQFVAVAFGNGTIHQEQGAVGRFDWNSPLECATHLVPYSPESVAISFDGRYALATSIEHYGRTVFAGFSLVDFQEGKVHEITEVDGAVHASFLPDTYQAVIARTEGRIVVYDAESRTLIREIEPPQLQRIGQCLGIGVSSDGQYAITCNNDGQHRLWDLQAGTHVERTSDKGTGRRIVFLAGNDSYAISRFTSLAIDVYDRATGELIRTLSEPSESGNAGIYALTVSPDGKTIAATTQERCIVWDIAADAL
jgi:WD40 repeat protein